ncbi:YceI family protein [Carnimonas nigrificans]|uniref:YceI family protein n=1 Tax=Carnimonas nigrificans TaxID=64323 RepID=UPI000470DD29|nr:YceI family protein [Carnimonas nigrificans]
MAFKKTVLSSLGVATLAAGLSQAPLAVAANVQSGTYQVEPAHTQVLFSVNHFGFTNYHGVFSGASGTLTLNADDTSKSKVDITIPIGTVQTTSDKLTEELKGTDWFNTQAHPNARFISTKVSGSDNDSATVEGNLTLNGVTKPVTLNVRFHGAGENPLNKAYTAGFDATTTIKRSEFGIKQYVPAVSDEVKLTIEGAFEKTK